ncbi:SusC/RagA family TonB-linked outer membrane protein [Terrimonas sp. NA20]|uniref:SusC/RagA family TonB-linked outer membrane protein n=1 Tax=Terrimonas ginsenosidimutans TaxID=2908004 RepID=A0ABS9KVD0_9BACT|nr:SusC/RagA family TonB-linked outer membrane protein [Terrimonas ginsenosidimutans]MCG2616240.1 SusC/RagA family TonB-linked outer membrane protein [Terrimonas ginsenosidimutans]
MKKKNIKVSCILLACAVFSALGGNAQEKQDSLVNVAFGTVAREDLLGAVSTVNVAELLKKNYAVSSLDNLQSFVGGYTGNIWGQIGLILVDGIPRRASDVRLTEVESITVLKGANAVVLYGSNAAKGVVLITTKRGAVKPLTIDVRANSGVFVPKGYPGYLNAADYMTLYNEALTNDGISTSGAGYTQDEIDKTRSGVNPFRYADIDFFSSDYLKKAYTRSDLTTEISGGNERTRYYTNIGLNYNNSIMKFGDQKNNNDFGFNVRGNVDMDLNSWLTASTDVAVNFGNRYAGRGDFWGASSTIAPNFNRYSPFVPVSMFDPSKPGLQTIADNSNHLIDGQFLLGGQSTNLTNVFGDMVAAGYIKTRFRAFMYNVGVNADLGALVKGLSFKSTYSLDYTAVYSEAYQLPYAVYRPTWSTVNGQDVITSLEKFNNDQNSTNEFIGRTTYSQTMSYRAQLGYNRTFGNDHNVTANMLGWWYMTQFSSDPDNDGGSDYHPDRNTNLGFQAGYNFRKKYYVDFSGAYVHSAKLPDQNRNAVSPTVTLGWRVSQEDFFKDNVSFIDDLKFTASYASIKQDIDITGTKQNGVATDYYLYSGYYGNNSVLGGWYQWRDAAAGGWVATMSGQGENPNLNFIERKEYRAGMQASFLKNLINLEANYFHQTTSGLLTRGVSVIPSYFTGSGDFRPWLNYNNDRRTGLDFALNVNNKIGDVQLSVGVVGMLFSSKALVRDEIQAVDYQNRAGRDLDAYWGLINEGFFQNQAEIDAHARQTFGGVVKPGDLKYKDVNGDGIIDSRDQVDLGRNGWAANPFSYGINFTVKYKNFTLFALGNGQSGAIAFKNTPYFWVRGASKYSDVVWGRWTEDTKNTATYPRLTSTAGANNFQNSTFWMYKNNRFNLSRVQLTYDFNSKIFKNSFVHGMSVYVLGDNLLVLSKERKLMETNVGMEPQYRFYNLGLRATF